MTHRIAKLGPAARGLAGAIKRSPRSTARALRGALLARAVERQWLEKEARFARAHSLPGALIVSLTSYPPRYRTLALTLKCLLRQTMAFDRLILWLGAGDDSSLPSAVACLTEQGLEILITADIRSYKKIVPTLRLAPDAFIATADDDVYYAPTWLEELVDEFHGRREILCHRAHRIALADGGAPAPYAAWTYDEMSLHSSPLLFPTGAGGVLYPPGTLHPDVLDERAFTALCPSADDAWLYFMGRRAGAVFRRVGRPRDIVTWPGSQQVALLRGNVGIARGNDIQIARLVARYGFPPAP